MRYCSDLEISRAPLFLDYGVRDFCFFRFPLETESSNNQLTILQDYDSSRIIVGYYSSGNEKVTVQLTDINGKQVAILFKGKTVSGNNFFQIDRNSYPKGLYIIQLETQTSLLSEKIILTQN